MRSPSTPDRSAPTRGRTSGYWARLVASILAVTAGAAYLTWRAVYTIGASWWLSLPLLGAEVVFFVRFALFVVTALPEPSSTRRALEPADGGTPEVELLVPAAHAGRDELSRTLALARRVGAAKVRVLDRIDRTELRREAHRLGADYEVHDVAAHLGAAGLVGAALSTASTELVAWVDAGDVVLPGFLDLAAGLTEDGPRRVGVVQSATDLINHDSLLHLVPDRDDLAVENRVVGPSLDRSGAAPWNGSGSIFRAEALAAIGGIPATTAATHRASMRFARAGWSVRWATPPAVRSVAPDLLGEHLASVGDAARGHFAVLLSGDSPLRLRRGVPLRRRAAQLHAATAVFDGLARFTLLALVAVTLVSGRLPFDAPLGLVVGAFTAQACLRTLALLRLGRGAIGVGDATRSGLRRMGVHVVSVLRAPRTASTDTRGGVRAIGQLRLLTGALVVIDIALVLRGLTFVFPGMLPRFDGRGRFVAMAAAVWAVVAMVDVLQLLVGRVQRRAAYRNVADLVARLGGQRCKVVDLTPRGIGLLTATAPAPGESLRIELDIPRLDGSTSSVEVTVKVRHVSAHPDPERGRYRAGGSFGELDDHARDALVEFCALTAEHRDERRSPANTTTPADLVVAGSGTGRRVATALSAVAVLFSGVVVAAGPAGAESMDPTTGSIAGRVVGQDGQPVAGMCVQTATGPGWGGASTDATGAFSLDGLAAGTYTVVAGNCALPGVVPTYSGSTVWPSQAVGYDVAAGATAASGDVVLQPAGTIEGSVVDGDGAPLEWVCASFVASGPDGSDQWFAVGNSDTSGHFSGAVPAGVDGRVQFRDCQWPQRVIEAWYQRPGDPATGTVVRAEDGATVVLDAVTMRPGITVTGHVTDELGAPVPSVCVNVNVNRNADGADPSRDRWDWVGGSNTDADGSYSLMVASGTYAIGFWPCSGDASDLVAEWYPSTPTSMSPTTVEVNASSHTFDAVLSHGGRISGTVVDTQGAPATGACVMVGTPSGLRDGKALSWSQVGADGSWLSSAVAPGDYAIRYQSCADQQTWIEELRPDIHPRFGDYSDSDLDLVAVTSGQTTSGIHDVLQHPARLAGTVTSGGVPVGGVCVGGVSGQGDRFATNADGSWNASVFPGSVVELSFTDCVSGRGLVQQFRSVTTTENQESRVDVDLAAGGSSTISGTVLNGAGSAPGAPTCVVAYRPMNLIAIGPVDAEGVFHIDGLADGDYWFGVIGCGEEDDMSIHFPDDPVSHEPIWSSGQPIGPTEHTSPDPAHDGVPVVEVRSASVPAPMTICVGDGCGPEVSAPTTTLPPTSTPPTTLPPEAPSTSSPSTPSTPPPAAPPETVAPANPATSAPTLSAEGLRAIAAFLGQRAATSAAAVQGVPAGLTGSSVVGAAVSAPPTATPGPSVPSILVPPSAAPMQRLSGVTLTGVPTAAMRDNAQLAARRSDHPQGSTPWDLIGGAALVLGAASAAVLMRRRRLAA